MLEAFALARTLRSPGEKNIRIIVIINKKPIVFFNTSPPFFSNYSILEEKKCKEIEENFSIPVFLNHS